MSAIEDYMIENYIEKLDCPDEAERIYAAEDLGYLNAPEGVPPLLEHLGKETSRAVREAIFQALTRIDAAAAIEGSIQLLGSDDPQIRNQAVEVLRSKGQASFPLLNTVMREGGKDVRKLVLDVLSGVQVSGAEAIYEAALSDQDANVVITAVENLGSTRAAGFRGRIEDLLLGASHPMLVGACLEALGGIGNELSLVIIRRRFPELKTLPDFLLVSCLKAIGALGTAGEFVEVAGLLGVRGAHLRPAILDSLAAIHQRHPAKLDGVDLLPALRAVVEDGDSPLCRYQAVRALAFLSSRGDVYAFLVSCLASPERLVRLGAIESLRMKERPELEKILASRALEETDEEVLQALGG
ncbi:MAG: HEAT repeat domain-containing protein [Bryobacteraceae bacterium]|jgi:HEAT repeat protein